MPVTAVRAGSGHIRPLNSKALLTDGCRLPRPPLLGAPVAPRCFNPLPAYAASAFLGRAALRASALRADARRFDRRPRCRKVQEYWPGSGSGGGP